MADGMRAPAPDTGQGSVKTAVLAVQCHGLHKLVTYIIIATVGRILIA